MKPLFIICLACLLTIAIPAAGQDECINEDFVTRRIVRAYPAVAVQERIEDGQAAIFGAYIKEHYNVPTDADLILRYGMGVSTRIYVVFFKDGCMAHDTFVTRERYEADKIDALGEGT